MDDTRPASLNRAGVHAISRADAKWFRKRPDATVRYRPAGEREWPTIDACPVPLPGMSAELWVEVIQLKPGVRVRRPYWVITEAAA